MFIRLEIAICYLHVLIFTFIVLIALKAMMILYRDHIVVKAAIAIVQRFLASEPLIAFDVGPVGLNSFGTIGVLAIIYLHDRIVFHLGGLAELVLPGLLTAIFLGRSGQAASMG